MLYDGIQLLGSSAASNFTIESGSTLPVTGNNLGELFYKLNDGLYVYNGSAWEAVAANISIGGGNTQVQFNDSGSLAGSSFFTFNKTTGVLHASSVTVNSDPTNALELATKQYVDNVASGLNVHNAVIAATTGPITATYNNGDAGVGATLSGTGTLPNIGGYATSVGDRILVKNQTDARQNGIYVVSAISPDFILTRTSDFDNSPVGEVQAGDFVYVQQSSVAGTSWVMTTPGTISFGTSNINWSQFSGQSSGTPGGANTQVQYNNNGAFGGSSSLTFNSATGTLSSTIFSGSGASLTNLNASNLTTGTVAVARLGSSGTASSSTFLRGDGAWATPTAAAAAGGSNTQMQFNNSGAIGGTANLTWDVTNSCLRVGSSGASTVNGSMITGGNNANNFHIDATGTLFLNYYSGTGGIIIGNGAGAGSGASITAAGVITGTSFSGVGTNLTALNANNLGSGTVPTARLGSGTANSTTYLRGDNTWATPTAGTDAATGGNITVRGGNGSGGNGGTLTLAGGTATGTAGSVVVQTAGATRLTVDATGAWLVGGSAGTANQVLTSNGAGAAPTWKSLTASGVMATSAVSFSTASTAIALGTHPNFAYPTAYYVNSSAAANQKMYMDTVDNNGSRIYQLVNDSFGSVTTYMQVDRSGITTTNISLAATTLTFTGNFVNSILPSTDNSKTLGGASNRWSVVYAGTGTINTSDGNLKQDVAELDEVEKRVALRLKALIRKFRFKDAVAEKGNDARIHVGAIAQDVENAFILEGLNPERYAVFCKDIWTDENGVEQTRLGIRYDEMFAFIISVL